MQQPQNLSAPVYPADPDPRIVAEIEERLRQTKIMLDRERDRSNDLRREVVSLRSRCVQYFIADQQRKHNIFRRIADNVILSIVVAVCTLIALKESVQLHLWRFFDRRVSRFVMIDPNERTES